MILTVLTLLNCMLFNCSLPWMSRTRSANSAVVLFVGFLNDAGVLSDEVLSPVCPNSQWASVFLRVVHWCLELSQPPGIISGLKETFIKRHTVERTSKAEIRPEEQVEKTQSCLENLWDEIQLKGP